MSLATRMGAIVGDENTVGRYLLEKIGHTALIAWALQSLGATVDWLDAPFVDPTFAAVLAATLYNVIGKALWLRAARARAVRLNAPHRFVNESGRAVGWWFEVKDTIFDEWVGLFVAVLSFVGAPLLFLPLATLWFAGFAIGSNNHWGSPS